MTAAPFAHSVKEKGAMSMGTSASLQCCTDRAYSAAVSDQLNDAPPALDVTDPGGPRRRERQFAEPAR